MIHPRRSFASNFHPRTGNFFETPQIMELPQCYVSLLKTVSASEFCGHVKHDPTARRSPVPIVGFPRRCVEFHLSAKAERGNGRFAKEMIAHVPDEFIHLALDDE
jgi:hypothetical protein